MKNISKDSKVCIATHVDLDGSMCALILSKVFHDITIFDTSFYKVDSLLENLDYDKYDFVFLTDIHPDKKSNLYLSDKIILLDHHESAMEMNDPSKMHYIVPGKCAAHLVKKFAEKYFHIDLSYLDDIVRLCNDYDMWELKYPESKSLNDIMFYLYRPKKFREKFNDGRTTFTEDELTWLKMREKKFQKLYKELQVFEFDKINGCVVESREFINEICDKLMKEDGYNIVFCRNPSHGRVSVRHNIEGLDMGGMLKKHGIGGGHFFACGMFVNDIDDFKVKINMLENEISVDFPK
jgi:oligoribonuclease NrnB/cAMP/cGMP phosphodiesterase (DHH superfamily)